MFTHIQDSLKMQSALKRAARSILGEDYYKSLYFKRQVLRGELWKRSPEGQRSRRTLSELHNKYAERRCFVIGNGPSLNKVDLTKLQGEVTIASNGIFLMFEKMGFVPTFYTIEDRLVARERTKEANAIQGATKVYPFEYRNVLERAEDTVWLNFRRGYQPFPQFSEDLESICFEGGTISFLNLQLAHWLGCPQVYLVGFDHNYVIPEDASVSGYEIKSNSEDPNHFHPDYFGKGYSWHDPQVDRMERSYVEAREHFQKAGRTVMNATPGGRLEVFPRVEYASLF